MVRNVSLILAAIGLVSVMLLSGCVESVSFQQDETKAMKVVSEEKTGINEISFVQHIDKVKENGSAVATVTIKDLQYSFEDKDGQIATADVPNLNGVSCPVEISASGNVKLLTEKDLDAVKEESVKAYVNTATIEKQLSKAYKMPKAANELQYTNLNLALKKGQSSQYITKSSVIKDFRFEQPNLGKLREEQTKTEIEMTFTQTIQSVDENGTATAMITIDGLKMDMVNKNEMKFNFDSQKPEDKTAPLAKLIGQSYTIKVTPAGTVESVDAAEALKSVTASYEKKIVQSLLEAKTVSDRHGIAALPTASDVPYIVNDSWSTVVTSPPGLLTPKSYKKTYTLTSIQGDVATVSMKGSESGEQAETQGSSSGGMGVFAKMFDNVDDYSGSMKLDTADGLVRSFDEALISTYTAQEMPANADPEKGPDNLIMRFTHRVQLEKLD